MAGLKWSLDEDNLLKDLWPTTPREEIIKFFNRTYDSLIIRASNFGIRKLYTKHPYVQSDLSVLLEETPIALYWIGFFMADGSVRKNRLKLVLARKDKDHLLAFKDFCKIPNYFETRKAFGVQAQDSLAVPKICSKYNIVERKTFRPTTYIPAKRDLFLSFLIGFIDGDGSIRKQSKKREDSIIAIKLHNSWLDYLNKLSERVSSIVGVKPTKAKIDKKGYAIVNLSNSIILKYLKQKEIELNLPVLQRKWERINLNYFSRNEKSICDRTKLVKLIKKGWRNTEIAKELGVSDAWVSINKRKLK